MCVPPLRPGYGLLDMPVLLTYAEEVMRSCLPLRVQKPAIRGTSPFRSSFPLDPPALL
ncbi:MAG: hypothetical protein AB7P33_14995 [Dehalococcoidia bacterium]